MERRHDVVVIGAGQAGLAMSHYLTAAGREHVLLERATVAERWRSERWDSLCLQFTNSYLRLPGHEYRGPAPGAFAHYREVLAYLEAYRERIRAPVEEGVAVHALEADAGRYRFRLTTGRGVIRARRVVIATGPFQRPVVPGCAAALPADIVQLQANAYRNPSQLPAGAVLVVGSGSSGCQIAEELAASGRRVFLSVGRHRRIPHRYRGRLMIDWLTDAGLFDLTVEDLPAGPPPPVVVTGVDGGHAIDLRRFAAGGIVLLGRLLGIEAGTAHFAPDVEARLAEADRAALELVRRVDAYVERAGVDAAAPDAGPPAAAAPPVDSPATLDLAACRIGTVLWSTGYDFDFGWLRLPVLDARGRPVQRRGVTACPGAYFLGLHWMHTFKSGTLFGVGEDAGYLAEHLMRDDA